MIQVFKKSSDFQGFENRIVMKENCIFFSWLQNIQSSNICRFYL